MTIPTKRLISRRSLLIGIGAIAAGIDRMVEPAQASATTATDALLSLLSDKAKAAVIGSAWVRQGNSALKPESVVSDLATSLQQQGWSGSSDVGELRTKYAVAVQTDYRTGNVVTIQGWQIARTQAELCALAYFSKSGLL
jgi:hypothetical protein